MGKTINIRPNFNEDAIREYADRFQTRDPQSHIQARLEVLSELNDLIEGDGEIPIPSALWVARVKDLHAQTTQEFLGFFGGPEQTASESPEFRRGPSDEVLIALAKKDYASEDIEIDTNAVVNRGDDPGAFVAAWVWVDFPDES